MKKAMVILSFDGLDTKDIAYLKAKPGFKRFLEQAAGSDEVNSIYPSVTYAAHASIITGCLPNRHGIVDNTKVQPQRFENPDWYWYQKDIKVPTLYDLAKQNDYTVAALLWPTTGRSKIDFNMPEIFSNRKWTSQMMVSLYAGTPGFQVKMVKRHDHLRKGKLQPFLDNFTTAVTLDTIHEHQPDMLLVHLTDLDSIRHYHGHDSKEASEALDRHDSRLTQILDVLSAYEKYNDCYIVILGDHSSKDVTHGISMNGWFKQMNFLEYKSVDAKGVNQFTEVDVFAKSCDGSCYIYLYSELLEREIEEKIMKLAAENPHLFSVHKQPIISDLGADPQAFLMLEAKAPYHFVDDVTDPFVLPIQDIPYYIGKIKTAVHGFSPELDDYKTCFYIKGPGIKPGTHLGKMSLIDIAPTLAPLLDFDLNDVDGHSKHKDLLEEATHETD
jgi:predicted AlkP superfamily pyrophosphatase or phosphodiesterase